MQGNETYITLDDTGRFALPRRLRDTLKDDILVLTKGAETSLWLYTMAQWKVMEDVILQETNPFSPRGRLMRQYFIGSKEEITIDKQGRIVISPVLRDHAQLSKECTIFGQGDYTEIWSSDRFKAHLASHQDDFDLGLVELGDGIMKKRNQDNA
jgi:MraZ protein